MLCFILFYVYINLFWLVYTSILIFYYINLIFLMRTSSTAFTSVAPNTPLGQTLDFNFAICSNAILIFLGRVYLCCR